MTRTLRTVAPIVIHAGCFVRIPQTGFALRRLKNRRIIYLTCPVPGRTFLLQFKLTISIEGGTPMQAHLKTALVVLVVLAVVYRIPQVKSIVLGA